MTKRPGPSAKLAVALMVIGALMSVPSLVIAIVPFVRTIETKAFATPTIVPIVRHLDQGTYEVYEYSGNSPLFPSTSDGTTDLVPQEIAVTAPSGGQVAVVEPASVETISRGGRSYTAVAVFDVPSGGNYQISVRSLRADQVIVAPSVVDQFRRALKWFGASALGALLFVLGLILLIVRAVRGNRAAKRWTPAWAYGPPGGPGWGPGPGWGSGGPPGPAGPGAPVWAPPPPPWAPPPASSGTPPPAPAGAPLPDFASWGAPPHPVPASPSEPPTADDEAGWGYTPPPPA